jgi:hypothetical protein
MLRVKIKKPINSYGCEKYSILLALSNKFVRILL